MFYAGFDLSSCLNLQSLKISLNLQVQPPSDRILASAWIHVLHILTLVINATCKTLSHITITVHLESVSEHVQRFLEKEVSPERWSQFEDVLTSLGAERLEKVGFKAQGLGRSFTSKISAKLAQSFPKLQERGILHFS